MEMNEAVVAVFAGHPEADAAVRKLVAGGFAMKHLSLVGRGYHTEEKVVGFYNIGDRVKFWGARGAFWGGLWGLFFGGLFLTIPVVGHVIVLGYLAVAALSAVEGAVVVGGLSAIGAALTSLGIPNHSVLQYETAVKADGFLVMAHGTPDEVAGAEAILATSGPTSLDLHGNVRAIRQPAIRSASALMRAAE